MSNMQTINKTLISQFGVPSDKATSISETLLSNYLLKGNDKTQFYAFFQKNFAQAHIHAGSDIDKYLEYMVSNV